MSSGFVSGGTIDKPTERDDEWRLAQAELEAKRLEKEDRDKQHDGKSLFEVLQANKAAKQEAFEEANRLKNQYRGLDDEEAEFLDSVLEATRKKEEAIRRETREGVDAFRKLQGEVERKALEGEDEEGPEGVKKEEVQWVGHGKKRKKGSELLKGVKLRRVGEVVDEKKKEEGEKSGVAGTKDGTLSGAPVLKASEVKKTVAPPPAKVTGLVALGLGYASSDEDD